jgi:hypothetical protein
MPCCGGNRARAVMSASAGPAGATPTVYAHPPSVAVFRYEGDGSLTVIGPATGRKYWFERSGAELAVDLRDRAAIANVPKLRQLRIV